MDEPLKKAIAIGVILFVMAFSAFYVLFKLSLHKSKIAVKTPAPSEATPSVPAVSPAADPTPFSELTPSSNTALPVGYIPTQEEIKKSIAIKEQNKKAMEDLMEKRNQKAAKVIDASKMALAEPSAQNDGKEAVDSTPPLSPEETAARRKEIIQAIKDGRWCVR